MARETPTVDDLDTGTEFEFEALLAYLKRSRGFDFTGYKRSSLIRRVQKRMQMVEVKSYDEYVDFLEVHPNEFEALFNIILINVTSFFRDAPAWEYLADHALPQLLSAKERHEPIRVWSAGCASGQEAYTLAMLLAEALGFDAFRERVKIYGTDADEEALTYARQATYSAREIAGVPPPLVEKYFEYAGDRYVFHKELRRMVIFGRHDLIQDAPISRVDLLTCRNVLMYFNSEVQARILARLHFALSDGGYLVLGKAEMLFAHANLFTPVDLKRRIFAKVRKSSVRDRLLLMAQTGGDQEVNQMADHVRMQDLTFETGPIARIVIEPGGRLAMINERARSLFRLSLRDIGRPLQDLELSYRPLELRSLIEQAYAEQRSINVKDIAWTQGLVETSYYDVHIAPLLDNGSGALGVALTFSDVTRYRHLQDELEQSNRELETAYEELQSTNEELETTNEELQSTVEELETTNEELQSTNEELETMNEELQSTNEELQNTNDEVRQRSAELGQLNAFLNSILTSVRSGIIVLDQNLQVLVWNRQTEDLWGLRSDEVREKQFLLLDIGLPVGQLRQPLSDCLTGRDGVKEIVLQARNRRGREFSCQVTCAPLVSASRDIIGVVLLMGAAETSESPLGSDG